MNTTHQNEVATHTLTYRNCSKAFDMNKAAAVQVSPV